MKIRKSLYDLHVKRVAWSRGETVIDERITNPNYSILWLNLCESQKRASGECRGFYTSNSQPDEILLCSSGNHQYPQLAGARTSR